MCKCNECIWSDRSFHLTPDWHAFKHKYQWSLPEFSGPPLLPRVIQILHPTCSPCLSCPFYCITLPKKWKECEVNAKCRDYYAWIAEINPSHCLESSFKESNAEMHAHSCAVCELWRQGEDCPRPLRFTVSVSLQLNTYRQWIIVDNDKNALSKERALGFQCWISVQVSFHTKCCLLCQLWIWKRYIWTADANFYYYRRYYFNSSIRKKIHPIITLYVFFFQDVLCLSHPCFSHFSLLYIWNVIHIYEMSINVLFGKAEYQTKSGI